MAVTWKHMLIALLVIAFVTITLFGKWDWLLYGMILLCPLMHLFGHNHHSGSDNHSNHHKH